MNARGPAGPETVCRLIVYAALALFQARALASDPRFPNADTALAQSLALATPIRAYAQIVPRSVVRVRAAYAGTLKGLDVLPGETVAAGDVLARIGGARVRSIRTTRAQHLTAAQAREATAERDLAVLKQQRTAHLATNRDVDAAELAVAEARAQVSIAQAGILAFQARRTVRAPVAGRVLAVQASNGEQTDTGETLLILQPADRLWIRATCYGADAARLHVGMKGQFRPSANDDSDAGVAMAVRVVSVAPSLAPDGGLSIGLMPASPSSSRTWMSGQWGTVDLQGAIRRRIVVPSAALVLDRGRWWVLLHTARGDRPQPVVPGPTLGWQTSIISGLRAGQSVVVQDAFLRYHRDIAQTYQPPD